MESKHALLLNADKWCIYGMFCACFNALYNISVLVTTLKVVEQNVELS